MSKAKKIQTSNFSGTGRKFSTKALTLIAVLSVLSIGLMFIDFPLWFAPNFYKIDISDVPAMIGAFTIGPVAGIFIELLKILVNYILEGSDTFYLGELANFIIGCSFVVPSAIIYQRKKTLKSAIIGLLVGVLSLVAIGSLVNAFIMLPAYAYISMKNVPDAMDKIIGMGTAVNPGITNMTTFILWAVAPFNLLKGVLISIITVPLYMRLEKTIKMYMK